MTKQNGMVPWPKDWPEYHNANVNACDMAVGPCACGSTHSENEFLHDHAGKLFRYGQQVFPAPMPTRPIPSKTLHIPPDKPLAYGRCLGKLEIRCQLLLNKWDEAVSQFPTLSGATFWDVKDEMESLRTELDEIRKELK